MKKFTVVAASASALAAAFAHSSALAHGILVVKTANFNAAAVKAAHGVIAIPWENGASAIYTVTTGPGTVPGTSSSPPIPTPTSLEVNSRFTVTLPLGFTFASEPTVTARKCGCQTSPTSVSLLTGGIGSNTATFVIGSPAPGNVPLLAGGMLVLNEVAVQGATALETPDAKLQISVCASNNAMITNNDICPVLPTIGAPPPFDFTNGVPPPFALTSDSGVIASFTGGSNTFIDLNPVGQPSGTEPGTQFVVAPPSSSSNPDTDTIDLGTLRIVPSGSFGANGLVEALNPADKVSVTIPGFFNGIQTAFANVGPGCGPPPHIGVSSRTETSLNFTQLPLSDRGPALPSQSIELCATASGKDLLEENTPPKGGFTAIYAPEPGSTDFVGGTVTNDSDAIRFAGGSEFSVTDIFIDTPGSTGVIRFSNGTDVTQKLVAVVEPYGAPTGPFFTTLPAAPPYLGTTFPLSKICTPCFPFPPPFEATVTLIAVPGGRRVTAGGLLVTGSTVDNPN